MSTEIALNDQIERAKLLADSSILPDSYRKQPANLLWAMELAEALDVSLAQAITGITVIQGKPTMSAEMMRALVLRAGHRFTVSDMTDKAVTVTVARKEWPDDVQQFTFSMADATHAGLAKSATYQKHPKAMLLARATSMACRAVFPDVVSGMGYVPEELGHDDTPKRVDTARLTPPKPTVEHVETVAETVESEPVDVETGEIFDGEVVESEPETLENEPESDESQQESDTKTPLTADQSHRITVALKALDLHKVDGLALYSEVCGRPVSATRDLSRVEAGLVLAHLETLTDA